MKICTKRIFSFSRNHRNWNGFLRESVREVHSPVVEQKGEVLEKLLKKYKNLRKEDQMKLINSHFYDYKQGAIKEIFEFVKKKEEKIQKEADEYEHKRRIKLVKINKPAFLQQKNMKRKVSNQCKENVYSKTEFSIEKEKELKDIEEYTLIEDLYKSYIYSQSFILLNNQYKTTYRLTNDFLYIMLNTIRNHILEKVRPTLINEFGVYKNPYMLLKNALFNYILYKYVKNPYEESLIEEYINQKTNLTILKINSGMVPVEVYEPLVSFRGDVMYNYNIKEKFDESITTSLNVVRFLLKQNKEQQESKQTDSLKEEADISLINEVLKLLPENNKFPYENYPFENLKSFKTNRTKRYMGGIKNNKPINIDEEEILEMRYPNLQCVAHSLPKDIKYRDNVIHAIKVLERSKYWDHKSKIKAINLLIEVWNNMHSSDHYESILDKSLPVIYTKDMLKKTKTRKDTFNKGLKYIPSLTTQKPLGARIKK